MSGSRAAIIFIRWFLSVVLLYVVWGHTHWSVAFTLTGLAFSNEMQSLAFYEIGKRLRK